MKLLWSFTGSPCAFERGGGHPTVRGRRVLLSSEGHTIFCDERGLLRVAFPSGRLLVLSDGRLGWWKNLSKAAEAAECGEHEQVPSTRSASCRAARLRRRT